MRILTESYRVFQHSVHDKERQAVPTANQLHQYLPSDVVCADLTLTGDADKGCLGLWSQGCLGLWSQGCFALWCQGCFGLLSHRCRKLESTNCALISKSIQSHFTIHYKSILKEFMEIYFSFLSVPKSSLSAQNTCKSHQTPLNSF
jgi:hypothetical protein